ncbi:proteasome inhibitor PI31 subunit-like [Dendronephthya gigantea]|uniref:proteasome inhibitor PI31 subunit-like n=1 Tax=Dendronephthya gigantea TaxID=151771 RepID=UPI00106B773E|nr:proteasome inhibitor PI31 subunit-like [Dendronephthya gigantea]
MAKERFANTLPFCGVRDGHDALVVAVHSFLIEAGYKCIGIGEQVSESVGNISTDGLPQGWNNSPDFYAIQYKQPSSYQRKFLLKVLRLDTRLAFFLLDVEKEDSYDLTIDTTDYVTTDNEKLLQNLYDYPQVIKKFDQLEQVFKSDIASKLNAKKEKKPEPKSTQNEPTSSTSRPVVYPDDPLRIPPRIPQGSRGRDPLMFDPRGFGDPDLLPGHPGTGGMFMDPFHQRNRRPEGDFGHPGLPRGAVPPGARFDPFGPPHPDGGIGGNPRSGRYGEPGPDHLRPPGFEDDMFM